MNHHERFELTRRDFVKGTLMAAGWAALPGHAWACSAALPDVPALDYSRAIILKNCRIIDVFRSAIIEKGSIRLAQGKIMELCTGDLDETGAEVIDLSGSTVIPGLIDAHCHTTASPVFGANILQIPKLLAETKRQYPLCIAAGVTTVRDMGAFAPILHGNIKAIAKGDMVGPRVVYCNSILNISGSHPDVKATDVSIFAGLTKPFIGMIPRNFTSMEDLREALEVNTRGAAFIKLTVDNQSIFCKTGNIPVYSDEHLKTIFDFAERHNLPVACHNHRKWGFDRITRYPIHSLEHMLGDATLTDAEIMHLVEKKIAVVPTMTVAQSYLLDDAYDSLPERFRTDFIMREIEVRKNYLKNEALGHFDPALIRGSIDELKYYKTIGREHLIEHKKYLVNPDLYFGIMLHGPGNLKRMQEAGVLIGCGIDAGMPFTYFGGQYREYELMSRAGFTNAEILRCATINNARILCMEDKIGSLEPGKYADIVVLTENPLERIEALRSPGMVFKEGRLLHCTMPLRRTESM